VLKEHILKAFEEAEGPLEALGQRLEAQLRQWFEPGSTPALKIHSIRMRVKDPASLARKLSRPDKTYDELWDVTDLIGLRIITFFDDEVDQIGRMVEARLPVDFQHSVDKRRHQMEGRFGYRSLHYIFRLAEHPFEVDPEGPQPRCEIQIRTMLEHAWAEIEHDLGYKSHDAMPAHARRRLHRLAGLLELTDQEFVAIRTELADYAAQLPARLASTEEVPLDRLSLLGLFELPECRAVDAGIASILDKPLGTAPFFPDYLLKMLGAAGFQTVDAVRTALTQHHRTILNMVTPYFAFASDTWGLTPDTMSDVLRGYAVFFVAHAHLLALGSADLTINAVMRLTCFYAAVDYRGDEREGQRIASLLVEAFRTGGVLS